MGGDPAGMDHPAQPQVGPVIIGAGAFDHLEHQNAGIIAQHCGKLIGSGVIGYIDQRRTGAIKHSERAIGSDATRLWRGEDRLDQAFAAAFDDELLNLDRLIDSHLRPGRGGNQGQERQEGGKQAAHDALMRRAALLQCQR